jgi:hypothetical protein
LNLFRIAVRGAAFVLRILLSQNFKTLSLALRFHLDELNLHSIPPLEESHAPSAKPLLFKAVRAMEGLVRFVPMVAW